MQNSQQQNEDVENQCVVPVVITTPIINGVIGGISSVITAYFFKPILEKIVKTFNWNKNEK